MNIDKLKQAEDMFLQRYPGGFENPEMTAIRQKKHNVDKMIAFAQDGFAERNFKSSDLVVQTVLKVINRSSLISKFEKPRLRDFIMESPPQNRDLLASGMKELLHGDEKSGFEVMLGLLKDVKLPKWSLMTACPAYFHPHRDVLLKPTTVKGIIEYYELEDLEYKPTPSWAFYEAYRSAIHEMESYVDPSLFPSTMAFSWFLLLSFHRNLF